MRKKQGVTVIASLTISIAVAFTATGCYRGVKVGDLQTKSQTVGLDAAEIPINNCL